MGSKRAFLSDPGDDTSCKRIALKTSVFFTLGRLGEPCQRLHSGHPAGAIGLDMQSVLTVFFWGGRFWRRDLVQKNRAGEARLFRPSWAPRGWAAGHVRAPAVAEIATSSPDTANFNRL